MPVALNGQVRIRYQSVGEGPTVVLQSPKPAAKRQAP